MTLRLSRMNKVLLFGRLTRDPELRFTPKGQSVCRFDLAVNRRYKDSTGTWKDDVTYVPIVSWNEAAKRCSERAKKGTPVSVEGSLHSRSWETKEGQKRNILEVIAQRIEYLNIEEASASSEEEEVDSAEDKPVDAETKDRSPDTSGTSDVPF